MDEFTANGVGGGYFAGDTKEFMVVSMGTGTSFVGVKNGVPVHLGGIGIGGGTIIGLSKLMLNTNDIDKIQELAAGDGSVHHQFPPFLFLLYKGQHRVVRCPLFPGNGQMDRFL